MTPGRNTGGARRGFALPVALLLMLVASLTLTAALVRQGAHSLAVERGVNEYRRHHEMFGIREMVAKRLTRLASTRELRTLEEYAATGERAFAFSLPGGTRVEAWVADGQGTMLEDLSDQDNPLLDVYAEALNRVPLERVDLVRQVGPLAISIQGARLDLFRFLLDEKKQGDRLASSVRRERERGRVTVNRLVELIAGRGVPQARARELGGFFTDQPVLWELLVRAEDGGADVRDFYGLIEMVEGRPVMRDWYEFLPQMLAQLDEEG